MRWRKRSPISKRKGVRPKYIYTIATVQNPTATILDEGRRKKLIELAEAYGVPIFEDDCYADLTWSGKRPPAIYAMSKTQNVIHIGSFSKTIAPALRVGFIVAPWAIMSHILALKTDAGSGGLEQMMLAEYCEAHFAEHVPQLRKRFQAKLDTLVAALNEQFGTAAEFDYPAGGIFLWVKLPDNVDAMKLREAALAAGVVINPGPEWSVNKAHSKSRIRLCFASPTHEEITRRNCGSGGGLPQGIRRAGAQRQCRTQGQGLSMATQPGILAIFNDVAPGREAEFDEWFQGEHLIERLARSRLSVRAAPPGDLGRVRVFQFLSGRVARGAHLEALSRAARRSDADDQENHVGRLPQHEPHGLPPHAAARSLSRRLYGHGAL